MLIKVNTWRVSYWIALTAVLISGMSITQEKVSPKIKREKVPSEVQTIINETMSGQHCLSEFDEHKIAMGFDSSTKLSDLKAGEPFIVYKILRDSLLKLGENVSISAIAKPLPIWAVPILINGKSVGTFEVEKSLRTQKWGPGLFYGCYSEWQKVQEAWPGSQGYHPIIVRISAWNWFFHVPEKDDSNLTPLYRHPYDSLERTADTSYKILIHSKKTLKYVKYHLPPNRNGGVK